MQHEAPRRRAIAGPGIPSHANPIPPAVRMGQFVFTSVVSGKDPASGTYPPAIEDQVRNAFAAVRTIMERAGGSTGDIARMAIYLHSREDRAYVNPAWIAMFPDAKDRPVRHTVATDLDPQVKIHIEVTAVI